MKNLWKLTAAILCLMLALPAAGLAEERVMPEPFASATFTDPYLIPYPAERDENGYLLPGSAVTSYLYDESAEKLTSYPTEGEFVYENKMAGLWAYLSPTLQVQIVRYDGNWDKLNRRWFVADVVFDPLAEQFTQHTYYLADVTGLDVIGNIDKNKQSRGRKGQAIWPKTLAQDDRMVLAVNGDYYPYRVEKDHAIGNILRQGQVIYDVIPSRGSSYPNLDSAAFFSDGSMAVFDARETTATEQQALGARDMVSFGPWLVRDGQLRDYQGAEYDHQEPRLAIGMVEPGHFVIIDCEGRGPNYDPTGFDLNELGALIYAHGANEAINMDGGNTTVLIFMGEQLNRIGLDKYFGSPRNQHELFGVGKSELVRTDWAYKTK